MNVTCVRSRTTSSASRWAPRRWRTSPEIAMSNSPVTVTTCWRRPDVWTIETRTGTSSTLFRRVALASFLPLRPVAGAVASANPLRLLGRLHHELALVLERLARLLLVRGDLNLVDARCLVARLHLDPVLVKLRRGRRVPGRSGARIGRVDLGVVDLR